MTRIAPPAAGARLPWARVPIEVRAGIERRLGSPAVDAADQRGGFSPGAAARLLLADGRRVFVKVVGAEPNALSPGFHRAEARIAAALPPAVPAPRLQFVLEHADWVALAFDDVDGANPALPWEPAVLTRVLDAVTGLALALDPSPVPAQTLAGRFAEEFRGWEHLAGGGFDLSWLDPWSRIRVDRLAAIEPGWRDATTGSALTHGDLRADNILLAGDRVVFVDWPHASIGASWFDVVGLGPSVIMQTGPAVIDVVDGYLAAIGADRDGVTAALVAVAGYFAYKCVLPAPPGLPAVPAFQRAQGLAALEWLRARRA